MMALSSKMSKQRYQEMRASPSESNDDVVEYEF